MMKSTPYVNPNITSQTGSSFVQGGLSGLKVLFPTLELLSDEEKKIVGDALLTPSLADATFALMDINPQRLTDSELVARKMIASVGSAAKVEVYTDQRRALEGADFVIVASQIGGYKPCTVTDFDIPRQHGLRQTIGDTLGVAGIMRGLRTVPALWQVCEDMSAVCPDALMLQYVNPMAINT